MTDGMSDSQRVRVRYKIFRGFLVAAVLGFQLIAWALGLDRASVAVAGGASLIAVLGISYLSEAAYFGRISYRAAAAARFIGLAVLLLIAYLVGRAV
jgi:hypothetical protein